MKKPIVYAHRGASAYEIENTIPSFELAIKMKADAVEFDVQLTADNRVVVFHDFTLERFFNIKKYISKLTADEIRTYTFTKNGKQIAIPFLDELLAKISHMIDMNIELKSGDDEPSRIERLCKDVYGLIMDHNILEDVVVSSFNIDAIVKMRELSSNIRLAILVNSVSDKDGITGTNNTLSFYIQKAKELRAEAINMSYLSVKAGIIEEILKNGFKVNIYTLNDDELIKTFLRKGIDGFFTNYPDRAIDIIEQELMRDNIQ